MSREIKSRGWIKEEKKMCNIKQLWFPLQPFPMRSIELDNGRGFGVDEVELMLFIGLHDKNNKEIYEGDIVRRDGYWDMYCVWDEEKCQFKFLCTDWVVTQGHSHYLSKSTLEQHEVIGNIYENPEFIKQEVTNARKQKPKSPRGSANFFRCI